MKHHRLRLVLVNLFILLVFYSASESVFAKDPQDPPERESASIKKSKPTFDLEIGLGYRIDDLDWSIAGFLTQTNFVNILSELTWEDLRIYQVKVGGRLSVPLHKRPYAVYMRAALSYGKIVDGENQDSDYAGNNRTLEFSRSNNDANDGTVGDGSIGVGFQSKRRRIRNQWMLRAAPLIGYSYHQQNLEMTNGFQTVPLAGPFSGLNSTYDAEWFGPWFGLDLAIDDGKKTTLFASIELHWDTSYNAEADWNLRQDFAHPLSFKHEADGEGIVGRIGWAYFIRRNLSINTTFEYQRWTTKSGTDTTFLSNGTVVKTPFNQATWESRALNLSLQYRFQ